MFELRSELLFDIKLYLGGAVHDIGKTAESGHRLIVEVTRGEFEGPKMKGTVPHLGADWLRILDDGTLVLDVRTQLQTDDGELIYLYYHGYIHGTPEVMETFMRFEEDVDIDPSTIYFRTSMRFETGSKKYDWLNRTLATAVGRRIQNGVAYHVYEIK
jgi:hypothetical protein